MSQDEQLREALLELQSLRQREARLLDETNALFDLQNALSNVETVEDALDKLAQGAMQAVKADAACVLVQKGSSITALTSTHTAWRHGMEMPEIPSVFTKPRNIAEIGTVDIWARAAETVFQGFQSVVSAPLKLGQEQGSGALLCLHRDEASFKTPDRNLLARMATLANQSLTVFEVQTLNRLLAAVIDGSSSGFAIADARDAERPLVFVNKAFEALTGYSAADAIGQNCRFLNAEAPDAAIRKDLRETVKANAAGTFVLRNRRKDGSLFWNELTLFPVMGRDCDPDYLVATQTDASLRVLAREESETNLRRMHEALSHTDDGFLLLDRDLQILYANDSLRDMLKAPGLDWQTGTKAPDNLAGYLATMPKSVTMLDNSLTSLDLPELAEKGRQQEVELPDGRTILVRAQRTDEGGLVVSTTNITAMKTAERTLQARVAALENAPDGFAIADASGRIIYTNPSLNDMMATANAYELLGRPWLRLYRADNAKDVLEGIDAALTARREASAQLAFQHPKGARRTHDVALRDVPGVGIIMIVRDVTEQLETQRRRAELTEQLHVARRQQVVSQVAAGLAHDFNNLLSAINGSALLISDDAQSNEAAKKHAGRISAAGTQAAYLVNRLLDLGRDTQDVTEFDLRASIQSALSLLSVTLSARTTLKKSITQSTLNMVGSPTEVTQIALNLVLNAQDSLPKATGTICVALAPADALPKARPNIGLINRSKSYARLDVSDTGSGMDEQTVRQIFDAYFSTKGDRGTGLGLSTVASMVTGCGGAMFVQTALGHGTTFTVYFPLQTADAPSVDEAAGARSVDLGGQLILIVDDDSQVAEVMGTYLERLGAEVAIVDDPALAVETVAEDPDAWSAVISDYNMPEMNGGDLVDAIRKSAPNLPILIVTALSRRLADPRLSGDAVQGIFAKPPNLGQISGIISDLNDKRRRGER